ncbi:hypothetical protein CHUAL_006413 [Chamberlinius hualienensis]
MECRIRSVHYVDQERYGTLNNVRWGNWESTSHYHACAVGNINSFIHTRRGEDCHKKIFVMAKWSAALGAGMAFHDVTLYSQVRQLYPILSRTAYWLGPFTSAGITYAAITCTARNLRGKEDYWNNAIGGVASGFVMGAGYRHYGVGGVCAVAFALVAAIYHADHDGDWFPPMYGKRYEVVKDYGLHDYYKFDFTLSKDPRDKS